MPHSETGSQVAERLLVLTLSLEDAVNSGDAVSTKELLTARAQALQELQARAGGRETAFLMRIRSAESRVLTAMQARRLSILADLVRCNKKRRSVRGYAACSAARAAGFSQIG